MIVPLETSLQSSTLAGIGVPLPVRQNPIVAQEIAIQQTPTAAQGQVPLQSISGIHMSTPAVQGRAPGSRPMDPGLSEISAESSEAHEIESELSGIEQQEPRLSSTEGEDDGKQEKHPQTKRSSLTKVLGSSFMDPFECTIASSEEINSVNNDSDEDYEPNYNMRLEPKNIDQFVDMSFGEMEFGIGESEDNNDEEIFIEEEPCGKGMDSAAGVTWVLDPSESSALAEDETFLVFKSSIMLLAKKAFSDIQCRVKGCKSDIHIQPNTVGSALYLKWICDNGHKAFHWCSQPVLNSRLHSGDLLISFAILTSGNNFAKIALFAKFLNLHLLSPSVFLRIQRFYLLPCITEFWTDHQDLTLTAFTDKVVVAVDKRECEGKSSRMEKLGFQKAMKELRDKEVQIGEVISDQHMQIAALMRNNYKEIKHSYDVWHAAKNLAKKINSVGQEKENRGLLQWTTDISNHFWYSCQVAKNEDEFRGMWLGVIHHTVNEHNWILSYGADITECCHGPLVSSEQPDDNQKWLEKGGPAHTALKKIVLDPLLLKKVPYFLNFRSTSNLENFNQLVLMYAAKRFAYSPPVYKARNFLAALDHNHHSYCEIQLNRDGSIRYHRVYNKKSSRWSVYPVKVKKKLRTRRT